MHVFYDEIQQQPALLAELLTREAGAAHALATAVRERDAQYSMLVARGTSDNAAVYGKYLLESQAGLPVALAAPSLYTLYQQPPRLARGLVLGVSQSGQSPDLVAVLAEARRQDALTGTLVNERHSPLAAIAEHLLWCGVGAEYAVAASKSFTAQMLLFALLAADLSADPRLLASLTSVPEAVRALLLLDDPLRDLANHWHAAQRCVVLGRGYAYAAALETALKLKETSYIDADAYSSADFLHGPIAVTEPGMPVVLFALAGPTMPGLRNLAGQLRERGAVLAAVTDDPSFAALVDVPLLFPRIVSEALAPIAMVVAGQLFAYHLAVARELDPDQPRGLHKVTATR